MMFAMCEAFNPEDPTGVNGTILLHQKRGEHLKSKGYLRMDPADFTPDEGRNKETKRIQVFENDPVGTCNILDREDPSQSGTRTLSMSTNSSTQDQPDSLMTAMLSSSTRLKQTFNTTLTSTRRSLTTSLSASWIEASPFTTLLL